MSNGQTPSRENVIEAARDFLRFVAKDAEEHWGPVPMRTQQSTWMVPTASGSSSMSSERFEREVVNTFGINMRFQVSLRNSAQELHLSALLGSLNIPEANIPYGYILPLFHHWLSVPDPLAFHEGQITPVLEMFCSAVVDGTTTFRSTDALDGFNIEDEVIEFEPGVVIRPVSREELFSSGEAPMWGLGSHLGLMETPSERWKMLDVGLESAAETNEGQIQVSRVRHAVLIALTLGRSEGFWLKHLGTERDYGVGAVGRSFSETSSARRIGDVPGGTVIDRATAERMKETWPRVKQIMGVDGHDLRLSAQRLYDGRTRNRADDQVLDYAIGLESLLLAGIRDELSYRFSLRGATILASLGESRATEFENLRAFYGVRSDLIHGSNVKRDDLFAARRTGETALRRIW